MINDHSTVVINVVLLLTVYWVDYTKVCLFCRVATVEGLKQYYVLMPADIKDAYLVHILDKYTEANKKSSIMIFTNTCK